MEKLTYNANDNYSSVVQSARGSRARSIIQRRTSFFLHALFQLSRKHIISFLLLLLLSFFFPPSRQFQFLLTRQITSRPRCNFSIFNAVIGDVFLHVRPSVHVSWEHFGQASLCLDIDCVVRAYYTGAHAKLRFQVSGHGNYAQRYVQRATSNAGSEESFFHEREIYFFPRFDIFFSLREKGKNQERIFCYFSMKSNFFFFKSIRFVPVSEAVSRNFKID